MKEQTLKVGRLTFEPKNHISGCVTWALYDSESRPIMYLSEISNAYVSGSIWLAQSAVHELRVESIPCSSAEDAVSSVVNKMASAENKRRERIEWILREVAP